MSERDCVETETMLDPEVHTLDITAIRIVDRIQQRTAMNEATVREYAEALQNGSVFPSIVVFYDGQRHVLADGFHRVQAIFQNGERTVRAEIHAGGEREAQLYAASNLLAVKVDHVPDGYFAEDGHTSQDMLYGWFAARMSLDLTAAARIENVVVVTETIAPSATTTVAMDVVNDGESAFEGEVVIRFTPWYPDESASIAAMTRFPVNVEAGAQSHIEQSVVVPEPMLWSSETPNLYKVAVSLVSAEGTSIDDNIVTTGLRTVRDEKGIFMLNDHPEMLNGATVMQFPAPLEEMSTWHRILPEAWIAKHILLAKAGRMNTLRMHTASNAYSDPRFAEYADQLGMMIQWVGTGWNRRDWAAGGDPSGPALSLAQQADEYVTDMRQVINHPSIVMWELFNAFVPQERQAMLVSAFYPPIIKTDESRLISFLKKVRFNETGLYDKPAIIFSRQDDALGYGNTWDRLRKNANKPRIHEYAVEFGEVTGQDNWSLAKSKPWYRIHSYEWGSSLYRITGTDPRTGQVRTIVIPDGEPFLD